MKLRGCLWEVQPGDCRGFFVHTVPLVLYLAAIFGLGRARLDHAPLAAVPGVDKVQHFVAFAVLTWLATPSLRVHLPCLRPRVRVVVAMTGATCAGALLELMQARLPHRSADGWDLLADALGALCAGIALEWGPAWLRFERKSSKKCA